MIRGCAIISGTFFGVLSDFWVPFRAIPGFLGIDFDILLMTIWNAACRALVSYFLQSDLTYFRKKNDDNKRIECLSNDSTIFISVLLCLCKEFHIVYNCYQLS